MLRRGRGAESFKGKTGQTLTLTGAEGIAATRLMLVGMGKREKQAASQLRTFAHRVGNLARTKGLKRLVLAVPAGDEPTVEASLRRLTEGVLEDRRVLPSTHFSNGTSGISISIHVIGYKKSTRIGEGTRTMAS